LSLGVFRNSLKSTTSLFRIGGSSIGQGLQGGECSLCSEPAVKSLSASEVSKYFKVEAEARSRVYLCKRHYKEYKKRSEEARELERLRW